MSRVGRAPIVLPKGVEVSIAPAEVTVKGPKGTLNIPVSPRLTIEERDGAVVLERSSDHRNDRGTPGEHLPIGGFLRRLHLLKTQMARFEFSRLIERVPAERAHSRLFTNRQLFEAPRTRPFHRLSIRITEVSIPYIDPKVEARCSMLVT